MHTYFQAAIGMLAVINPVVCGTMLLQSSDVKHKKTSIFIAAKSMLTIFIILAATALGGKYILNAFGISIDAFRIVGGIVLGFIGFQMLAASNNVPSANKVSSNDIILFAASPGTIAMVISLAAINHGETLPVSTLIGIVIAVLITLIIMIMMVFLLSEKSAGHNLIFSKFMGLIIVSMGIQFALTGIKHFFGI
jgi:multiple antibiotic resistance protein